MNRLVFVILAFSLVVAAQRKCQQQRKCVPLDDCPQLKAIAESSSPEDAEYIAELHCDFVDDALWVCCNNATASKLPQASKCGMFLQDRIVNGDTTSREEYPWAVQIIYRKHDEMDSQIFTTASYCGGVLISNQYALSAAHCFENLPSIYRPYYVRVGEWNTTTDPDCDDEGGCNPKHQDIVISKKITHPKYSGIPYHHNDIVLLRLGKPVVFSQTVKPICLPKSKTLNQLDLAEKYMIVVGWGATETKRVSDIKMKVQLKAYKNEDCAVVYQSHNKLIVGSQICAGSDEGKDSCTGDSGGPMMRMNVDASLPYWYLVGLVSYGNKQCGRDGVPGVYTRITMQYIDWIEANIRD